MKKYLKKIFIIGLIISIIAQIVSYIVVPHGNQREKMQSNLIEAISEQELLHNYSIYLTVENQWTVRIVCDEGKLLIVFEGWKNGKIGYWENNILMVYKGDEVVLKKTCSFEQLQKKLGFRLNDVNQIWQNKVQTESLDKKVCKLHTINSRYPYTWKLGYEKEKEMLTVYTDSDRSGKKYECLGIEFVKRAEDKKVCEFQMCFSNLTPVNPYLITDSDFGNGSDCLSYKELEDYIKEYKNVDNHKN